jgi:Ca2+-binding EF-hand superfamily protein
MKAKHEQGGGKEQAKQRWDQADTDHDGQLSHAEAEKGMPQLAKHFDQLDANKDGKLSPDELRGGHKPRGETKPL